MPGTARKVRRQMHSAKSFLHNGRSEPDLEGTSVRPGTEPARPSNTTSKVGAAPHGGQKPLPDLQVSLALATRAHTYTIQNSVTRSTPCDSAVTVTVPTVHSTPISSSLCCRPEGKGLRPAAVQTQRAAERGRLALRKLRHERKLAGLTAELQLAVQGNLPAGQHSIQRRYGRTATTSLHARHDHCSSCRLDGPTAVISGATLSRSNKDMQSPGMISCCAAECHTFGGPLAQPLSEMAGASVLRQDPVQRTAHVQWKLRRWQPQAPKDVFSSIGLKESYDKLWPGMNCLHTCKKHEVPRGLCPVLPYKFISHTEE